MSIEWLDNYEYDVTSFTWHDDKETLLRYRFDDGFKPIGYYAVPQSSLTKKHREWIKDNSRARYRYTDGFSPKTLIFFDEEREATLCKIKLA